MDSVDERYEPWTIFLHVLMVDVLVYPLEVIEISFFFLDFSMGEFEED